MASTRTSLSVRTGYGQLLITLLLDHGRSAALFSGLPDVDAACVSRGCFASWAALERR